MLAEFRLRDKGIETTASPSAAVPGCIKWNQMAVNLE
jgi:hypothetical protein